MTGATNPHAHAWEAYFLSATDHREAGRIDDALAAYGQALAAKPDFTDAYVALGDLLLTQDHADLALAAFQNALLCDVGAESAERGLRTALTRLAARHPHVRRRLAKLNGTPHDAAGLLKLGEALAHEQLFSAAESSYRRALQLRPGDEALAARLSLVLLQQERWQETTELCTRLLAEHPDSAVLHGNRAIAHWKQGSIDAARGDFERAIALRPGYPQALANLATMLSETGFPDGSLPWCEAAVRAMPGVAYLHNNLGLARLSEGLIDASAASFDEALALQPGLATAHYNRSFPRLLRGDLSGGFADYESRFDGSGLWADGRPDFGVPEWDGGPLAGKRLLVHAEQGFGDTLQFIRYVRLLAGLGPAALHVHVQPELLTALRELQDCALLAPVGSDVPAVDFSVPLLSLPHRLRTTLATIPGATPYLSADPVAQARWRPRLPQTVALRVGLCWSGNASHPRDRERSLPLASLRSLADAGVAFVSLQKGPAAREADHEAGFPLLPLSDDFVDFADTAAVIAQLDLVISVDTSVAHLAGALGKPVWLLVTQVPDPRWLLGRDDSPWYPSLRLFRQDTRGDWPAAVERLRRALLDRAAAHVPPASELGPPVSSHEQVIAPTFRWITPIVPTSGKASRPVQEDPEGEFARCQDRLRVSPQDGASAALAGNALAALARGNAALAHFLSAAPSLETGAAILAASGDSDALTALGSVLSAQGLLRGACASYQRALAVQPTSLDAITGLSDTLIGLERWQDVEVVTQGAVRQHPESPELHCDLATAYWKLGQTAKARSSFATALALRPGFAQACINLGAMLHDLGEYAEALQWQSRALAEAADNPDLHSNRASAQERLGQLTEARVSLDQALALRPDQALARFNRGIVRLLQGDFTGGWVDYESRIDVVVDTSRWLAALEQTAPRWQGEPLRGKRLVICAEQGFGDTLQFIRYLPLLHALGPAALTVQVQAELQDVLADAVRPWAELLPRGADLPEFDLCCALLSLPGLLGTQLDTIPATVPYLVAEEARRAVWRERLAAHPGFRVGLCWAGNRGYARDAQRSIALATLASLAREGVVFVSLQKGPEEAQLAEVPELAVVAMGQELNSFADTAALIAELDLVISVDTAVAHLTGALGRPLWLMLPLVPDWRWLEAREDSPWYPSARLFRQSHSGAWPDLAQRVSAALTALTGRPAANAAAVARAAALATAGWVDFQAGRLADAEPAYRAALAADPQHPAGLHGLALLAHVQGRDAEAEPMMRRALAGAPREALYHYHLGRIVRRLGAAAEALRCFEQAVNLDPTLWDAQSSLALAYKEADRLSECLAVQRRVVAARPAEPGAHLNLANTLLAAGDGPAAAPVYLAALRLSPAHPGAIKGFQAANLQIVESMRAQLQTAAPGADAHCELATALWRLRRYSEAAGHFEKALTLRPGFALACSRFGEMQQEQGKYELAREWHARALRLAPDDAQCHVNLAAVDEVLGDAPAARAGLDRALTLRPDFAYARFNRGLLRLLDGDFAGGFGDYEARLDLPAAQHWLAPLAARATRWTGEGLDGRTLLVCAEQGLGDTLQFFRYLPALLAAGAGRITLQVQDELTALLQANAAPGLEVLARSAPLPACDLYCALLSLPALLGTRGDTLPASASYLVADPARIAAWQGRLAAPPGLRVGLCWAGGRHHQRDASRSLPAHLLGPLVRSGTSLISLQQRAPGPLEAELRGLRMIDLGAELQDFGDTAAVIAQLDLVISVDTAVAHLAGALGRPVWVLLPEPPDWRWLRTGEHSPWYPSARLFRQTRRADWKAVVDRVAGELSTLSASQGS